MEEITLKASKRSVLGRQVKALRRDGILPAVVYGRRIESFPISLDMREASRMLERAATSALIVLDVEGEKHYTLVREKQRHPVLGTLRHVDFQAVERVLGIDLASIQDRILTIQNRKAIEFASNCKIKSEGVELVVKDRRVVSII